MFKKIIYTLCLLLAFPVHAQDQPPIVIELFTSQGCPSCPPADAILSELAENENFIVLGCHVSYWNQPQWKDKLSQDFCDVRQHGIQGFQGTRNIYTPQMVINGTDIFIGSKQAKIDAALDKAQDNPVSSIRLKRNGKIITFELPAAKEDAYRLWGFGYKNKVSAHIGGGENSGRVIDYTNPVMSYSNLGPWNGNPTTQRFELPNETIDGMVIFGQKDGYGAIVAAGKLKF